MTRGALPGAEAQVFTFTGPVVVQIVGPSGPLRVASHRGRDSEPDGTRQLGPVSRARFTQIMSLLNPAPDIQEAILFLPLVKRGKDTVTECQLRPIAQEVDWERQRELWDAVGANFHT